MASALVSGMETKTRGPIPFFYFDPHPTGAISGQPWHLNLGIAEKPRCEGITFMVVSSVLKPTCAALSPFYGMRNTREMQNCCPKSRTNEEVEVWHAMELHPLTCQGRFLAHSLHGQMEIAAHVNP